LWRTACFSLEGNNNPEEINRLFRAIHTVKRIPRRRLVCGGLGGIAHRVEDLIGRFARRRDSAFAIRGGPLPGIRGRAERKTLHREWADEAEMRGGASIPCWDGLLHWHRRRLRKRRRQRRFAEIQEEAPV